MECSSMMWQPPQEVNPNSGYAMPGEPRGFLFLGVPQLAGHRKNPQELAMKDTVVDLEKRQVRVGHKLYGWQVRFI